MKPLSLEEFGQIVARIMETLPAEFKPHVNNVTVEVQEEPDLKTLQLAGFTDEEIEAGESLFGLNVDMDLFRAGPIETGDKPSRIIIYKLPHEECFPDREQLMVEIRKTVIHELAHHFDYTERDLEKFDANPDPFRDKEEQR